MGRLRPSLSVVQGGLKDSARPAARVLRWVRHSHDSCSGSCLLSLSSRKAAPLLCQNQWPAALTQCARWAAGRSADRATGRAVRAGPGSAAGGAVALMRAGAGVPFLMHCTACGHRRFHTYVPFSTVQGNTDRTHDCLGHGRSSSPAAVTTLPGVNYVGGRLSNCRHALRAELAVLQSLERRSRPGSPEQISVLYAWSPCWARSSRSARCWKSCRPVRLVHKSDLPLGNGTEAHRQCGRSCNSRRSTRACRG